MTFQIQAPQVGSNTKPCPESWPAIPCTSKCMFCPLSNVSRSIMMDMEATRWSVKAADHVTTHILTSSAKPNNTKPSKLKKPLYSKNCGQLPNPVYGLQFYILSLDA